jgi:hypothetical protein
VRASRGKAASRWMQRTNQVLICANNLDQKPVHHACMAFSNWIKPNRPSTAFSGFICLLTLTTTSNARITGKFCLNNSRIIRLVKFLEVAAGVIFFLIAIPNRE